MTVLHINSSARMNHSNTRTIGQYLVSALGEPVISKGTPEQVIAHGIQQVDALIAGFNSSDTTGAK